MIKLRWLTAVALVLAVARWLLPLETEPPEATVIAAVGRTALPRAGRPSAAVQASGPRPDDAAEAEVEAEPAGNLFVVKLPPAPPAPPPAPRAPVQKPVAAFVAPVQAVPPPPFQVIGTYRDAVGPAVFLQAPGQTLVARLKANVAGGYRVTEITVDHVTLTQLSTQRVIQLTIPAH